MKIGLIILAAGESSRLGTPKQLLTLSGRTLLQKTIDTARAFPDFPLLIVLGAHADVIRESLDLFDVQIVENADWPQGMGTSLSAGLCAFLRQIPDLDAAVFLVCDQPRLTVPVLENLLAAYQSTGSHIVASAYNDALGVPALFDRRLFPELLALEGHEGARTVIRRHRERTTGIPFPDGQIDIDTQEDYRACVAQTEQAKPAVWGARTPSPAVLGAPAEDS